jgi:TDG/mug DNA glycosylase family protein
MADEMTAAVYEASANRWAAQRTPGDRDGVDWVESERRSGPLIDVGTGPGWDLTTCASPSVGLDVARAMLTLARERIHHPLVQASAAALPFLDRSLGAAIARRVYNHLPLTGNPVALADLHRCLQPEAPVLLEFIMADTDTDGNEDEAVGVGLDRRSPEPFPGRLFSMWTDRGLADLVEGAGFEVVAEPTTVDRCRTIRARRRVSLPDIVGPRMGLLVCGLNPSRKAAEMGVGFGRPGNRFWPAALAAGLVSVDRDPRHALHHHGLGMTDLVKRTTRRADELTSDEYRRGLARVERLVGWLRPRAVCFVGLAGWRTAVDGRARPGVQPITVGGRPVYVMPSTSGLNAHSRLDDLVDHLRAAADLASAHPVP